MRAEVDWKHFRANNDITEQAVYPDSHYWHFGVIALRALIESQTPRRVRARGPGAGALRRRQMAPARKKIQIMPVTLAPSITPVIVYVVVASSGDVFGVFKNRVKAVRVAREHRGMSVFMWLVDPGQA